MSGAPSKPKLLLVTGMSGAGKSTVLDALEDMGWDIVDNLPADLLQEFVHGSDQCRTVPVAIGILRLERESRGAKAQGDQQGQQNTHFRAPDRRFQQLHAGCGLNRVPPTLTRAKSPENRASL